MSLPVQFDDVIVHDNHCSHIFNHLLATAFFKTPIFHAFDQNPIQKNPLTLRRWN